MTYCSIQKIRQLSQIESEDASDTELRDYRDDIATPHINDDLNQEINAWEMERVANYKDNTIDDSNKTFYLKETHNSNLHVGDFNDDGEVDKDDIQVYYIDGDDNRVVPTIVSLDDASIGQFTMEKQNGDALKRDEVKHGPFVSYAVAPADMQTPAKKIEAACGYLTGALAYSGINVGNFDNFSVGSVSVNDTSEGSATEQMRKYEESIQRIGQRELLQSGENKNNIENVFTNVRN